MTTNGDSGRATTAKKASGSPAGKASAKAAPAKKAAAKRAAAKQAPAKRAPATKAPIKAAAKTVAKPAGAAKKPSAEGIPAAVASSSSTSAKSAPGKRTPPTKLPAPTAQEVKKSKPWMRARKRAEGVLNDPNKLRKIAQDAADKSQGRRSGPLSEILDQVSALIRLVVAYARGHYRDVSPQTMITVVAGLIYFVSPVDLVPDFLPGGFLDDAVMLGWVIRSVRQELEAFTEWELGQEG